MYDQNYNSARLWKSAFGRSNVINLANRPDRLSEFLSELKKIGLQKDCIHIKSGILCEEALGFRSPGERGCFLSHLEILRASSDNNDSVVLIIEDDCNFTTYFIKDNKHILSEIERGDWDIFYGGHNLGDANDSNTSNFTALGPNIEVIGAHFIAFRSGAIERLVPFLEKILERPPGSAEGGPMPVDGAYNFFRAKNPGLKVWAAKPRLSYQRYSRSDIAPPGLLDRGFVPGFLRDAIRLIRRTVKGRKS